MKWLRRELVTMLRSGELLAAHRDELCVMQRRRSVPHTFEENIAAEKAKLEALIAKLKHGPQRDQLLKKIRQLETASHMSEWLSSPGLHPRPSRRQAWRGRPAEISETVNPLSASRQIAMGQSGPCSGR
jgi:hypothetical protein